MDSREPNDQELARLQQLHAFSRNRPMRAQVWCLLLVVLNTMNIHLLHSSLVLSLSLAALLFMLMLWDLTYLLRCKCPRCKARLTLPRGRCLSCGLSLDTGKLPKETERRQAAG